MYNTLVDSYKHLVIFCIGSKTLDQFLSFNKVELRWSHSHKLKELNMSKFYIEISIHVYTSDSV